MWIPRKLRPYWIAIEGRTPKLLRLAVALPIVNFVLFVVLEYAYYAFGAGSSSNPICAAMSSQERPVRAPALVCWYARFGLGIQFLLAIFLFATIFAYRRRVTVVDPYGRGLEPARDEALRFIDHDENV
jgi:hypothetical protein